MDGRPDSNADVVSPADAKSQQKDIQALKASAKRNWRTTIAGIIFSTVSAALLIPDFHSLSLRQILQKLLVLGGLTAVSVLSADAMQKKE